MRLLLATDGSPCAERALQLLVGEPWPTPSVVRVVTVLDEVAMSAGNPWPIVAPLAPFDVDEVARAAAAATLEHAAERLRPVLAVETAVLVGRPAQAIADDARRWEADAIVMGSRGHGPLSSMVLGSVSAEVIDLSDRPVLVARGDRLRGVVLGIDGSAGAERAVDLVLQWLPFRATPIHVVSVAPSMYPWWVGMAEAGGVTTVPQLLASEEATRAEEEGLVQATVERLAAAGYVATGSVREGDAADQLIRAVAATGSDLIVVGTRGRTGLTRLVLGSVARNVVTHAPCSVLVVHTPRVPVADRLPVEPAATAATTGEPLAVTGGPRT
ncbi:MAG TPA: universal stress protein [Candidatus Baltobacteraceae bacterium]|nr:universal stress protein [Candidatus Baltobacteraceae bacterium]